MSFQLNGSAAEIPILTNGSAITPTLSPVGLVSLLHMAGFGSLTFDPSPGGPGFFLGPGGQQNTDSAFLSFQGLAVKKVFSMIQGEVDCSLKSNYSYLARQSKTVEYVFDGFDNANRLFSMSIQADSISLSISYQTGGTVNTTPTFYYFPRNTEDAQFGAGKTLLVRLTWDGIQNQLFLNNILVKTQAYTPSNAVWNSNASFTIGSSDLHIFGGGYYTLYDTLSHFNVMAYVPPPDFTAPTVPGTAVALPLSASSIGLTWTPSTDNVGVTGYDIYRGGVRISSTPVPSFIDVGLGAATVNQYKVNAFDDAGNYSGFSPNVSATTFALSDPTAFTPVAEWTIQDGPLLRAASGALGATGVTVEFRRSASAHGSLYDIRLRNRTVNDQSHTSLRVRIPRSGSQSQAVIEGQTVALPAEVHQWWEIPTVQTGAMYGFAYEIKSGAAVVKGAGTSTVSGQWGGQTSGVVHIDGRAYVIPEFWERQPRRIQVTSTEIILTLVEGIEPLRAGEDAWDRFGIFSDAGLTDADLVSEMDNLPVLSAAQRDALRQVYAIAPEAMTVADAPTNILLRKYDQWQGTSWDSNYADAVSGKTTLFTMFSRGGTFSTNSPGVYGWRDYGDILWGDLFCDLHYDWLRSGFKFYLKTGNPAALKWAMAAMRHAVSVDFTWKDTYVSGDTGFARYEKGNHGSYDSPKPTHTWDDGLFIGNAVTNDPWVREAAVQRVEGAWSYWGAAAPAVWDGSYGEIRAVTWPLLILVRGFQETGNIKYWTKATQLVGQILQKEKQFGGLGYISDPSPTDPITWPLMHCYSIRPMLAFYDVANARGEWTPAMGGFMERVGHWLSTPVPDGPYFPPAGAQPSGGFAYFWCPPGKTCSTPTSSPQFVYSEMAADLFAWLAQKDPATWTTIARRTFSDAVNYGPHPLGHVGYLTNEFPGSETKALGWIQLYNDRSSMWLGGKATGLFPPFITSFMANKASVAVGQSTVLTWTVAGAANLIIDQSVGSVAGSTSITVSPTATTTYTLTASNIWGSVTRTVTVTVALTSVELSNVRVYPNPWRRDKHSGTPYMTFDRLPLGSTVNIFTISGHHIKTLTPALDAATWDLTNNSGDRVASGIYLYLISAGGQKIHGKMAIIK